MHRKVGLASEKTCARDARVRAANFCSLQYWKSCHLQPAESHDETHEAEREDGAHHGDAQQDAPGRASEDNVRQLGGGDGDV